MNIIYEQKPFDFSFEIAGSHRGWDIYWPSHFHNHIEIVYMSTGSANISIDLNEYTLEKDDLLVVFPNQVHSYTRSKDDENEEHSFAFMMVDPYFIPRFFEKYKGKSPSSAIIKGVSKNEMLSRLVKLLCDSQQKSTPTSKGIVKGLLYSIIEGFVEQNGLIDQPASEKSSLKTIIKFCSENYNKDISLDMLEQELFLSKYYISHVLHDKMKTGFFEYVNFLRVSEACNLLMNTDMSISKVGEAVGFKSTRTFNRAFVKLHGIPPHKYKSSKAQQGTDKK